MSNDMLETIFEITNSVKAIASWAFEDCQSLEDIIIPSNVTRIEQGAFWNSKILNEASDGLIIRNGCLLGYNGLPPVSITLSGVRLVAEGVFAGGNSLESVILPEGVSIVNDWNFYGCRALKSIAIPASLNAVCIMTIPSMSNGISFFLINLTNWGSAASRPV